MRRLRWLAWVIASFALAPGAPAVALEPAPSCVPSASSVLIRVHGVRSTKGTLVAVLYGDNPAEFLKKGGRLARERVPAQVGSVAMCLGAPRPGVYAVAVYHDENDNRQFDRSWIGLPSEGFGVSNNPRPVLRAPTHRESAFEVGTAGTVVNVDLQY